MRMAIIPAPHAFDLIDTPTPTPAPDEVLVRVAYCGVCLSEIDVWAGTAGVTAFPRYPGHEVSGVVAAVGVAVTRFKPGDHVAVWLTVRGFADYVAAKEDYCLPTGDVPLDLALAEPLACAVNAVILADVALGDDVVIIGAGFMGHLLQKLITLRGPRHVIVADTRADALTHARALGATRTVNVMEESLRDVILEMTDGRGADVSVEVTGAQAPLRVLGDITRMSGTVAIVGYHQGEDRVIPLGQWNYKALHIVNAHFRDEAVILRGMRGGMRLLTTGRITLDGLVTHRFSLPEIDAAFRMAHEKPEGFIKATVAVGAGQ